MKRTGFYFQFEVPNGWDENVSGTQHVFWGPLNQEIIVSGYLIEGIGPIRERAMVRQKIIDNAIAAVKKAASHPDLVVEKEFKREDIVADRNFESWKMESMTRDGEFVFSQAIIACDQGVVMITFEAPRQPENREFFARFLQTFKPVENVKRND